MKPLQRAIADLQGKRTDAAWARELCVHRNYPARWKSGTTPSTEHLRLLVQHGLKREYLLGDLADRKPLDNQGAATGPDVAA